MCVSKQQRRTKRVSQCHRLLSGKESYSRFSSKVFLIKSLGGLFITKQNLQLGLVWAFFGSLEFLINCYSYFEQYLFWINKRGKCCCKFLILTLCQQKEKGKSPISKNNISNHSFISQYDNKLSILSTYQHFRTSLID